MRQLQKNIMGIIVVLLAVSITGCGKQKSVSLPMPSNPSTINTNNINLTVHPLTKGNPTNVCWDPTGNRFSYFDLETGVFEIGTVNPFSLTTVRLPEQQHIVALTDNSAIVASYDDDQDWIYPLTAKGLGKPEQWRFPTDLWQEWVNTQQGPAILVGGYTPKSMAIQLGNGKQIHLNGEDTILSIDGKYGAVVSSHRLNRTVHPEPHIFQPAEHQPILPGTPITIWNFAASGGPKQQSVLQLPPISAQEQDIMLSISPDDSYVYVAINTGSNGSTLTGESYLFRTSTGRLLCKIPYGNGMQWIADGTGIWVNTNQPQGSGEDKVVTFDGQLINTWKDVFGRPAWILNDSTFLLSNSKMQLGVTSWDHIFHAIPSLNAMGYCNTPVFPSPNGKDGLLFLYDNKQKIYYQAALVEM